VTGWTGICAARDLTTRPRRVVIDGVPVVVFRANGALHALSDVCPHRFAPLSMGRVLDDRIECPYHGWQFDTAGQCQAMPGCVTDLPRARVPVYAVTEHDGVVFVSLKASNTTPYSRVLSGQDMATAYAYNQVEAPLADEAENILDATHTHYIHKGLLRGLSHRRYRVQVTVTGGDDFIEARLADVAENILDATHTHYIHKGLLRGLSHRRYRVQVTVTGGDDFIEARYEGEPQQEGLVSRLFEAGRGISIGRFRAPGVAEIEFWGRRQVSLVTTFHLRQETPKTVAGLCVLSGPKEWGLGYLKAALFRPLFRIGVEQDRVILSAAGKNRDLVGDPKPMIGPLDILRSGIDAILRGERPVVADLPMTMEMEL
jgi:phenylpropionate dioxygenase-like ring-hydroxylating dioxygenase large terminal subunit